MELKSSFEFPSTLDFANSQSPSSSVSSEENAVPSLLYTPRNAPLHGHEHELVKLLSSLDGVESHGEVRVRQARKELVVRIERDLAALDERKWDVWRAMNARREVTALEAGGDERDQGEGENDEVSHSSDPAEGEREEAMSAEASPSTEAEVREDACTDVPVNGDIETQQNSKDGIDVTADQENIAAEEECGSGS